MKKKYVLKNKRRFIIIVAVLVSILLSTLIITTTKTEGFAEKQLVKVVVEPGDTLWDIVCDYYGENIDIRRMISGIKKENKMVSSELYVGQIILVPVK